jgi:hypothetical protein
LNENEINKNVPHWLKQDIKIAIFDAVKMQIKKSFLLQMQKLANRNAEKLRP